MSTVRIWNKQFELELIYDCYEGEEVLDGQVKALDSFLSSNDSYEDFLLNVKEYCKEHDGIVISDDSKLFSFVIPRYLFVTRDSKVSIMCDYRCDMEHGIAVVFKDGKVDQIGIQDIVL